MKESNQPQEETQLQPQEETQLQPPKPKKRGYYKQIAVRLSEEEYDYLCSIHGITSTALRMIIRDHQNANKS